MMRLAPLVLAVLAVPSAAAAGTWDEVRAILEDRCQVCHIAGDGPLGLSLMTHADLMAGSENGPVVLPGDPASSPLVARLRGTAEPRMPLDGPPFLDEAQIAAVEAWIAAGAEGPAEAEAPPPAALPGPEGPPTFAEVGPIFLRRCVVCHSDNGRMEAPPEGLRLGSLAEILAGGDRIAVVPGNPEASEVWRRITGLASPRMPFDGPPWLSDDEIALIRDWIAEGARDATGAPSPVPAGGEVRLRGRMTGPQEIDGAAFQITGATRVDERPPIGAGAELRATVGPDGGLVATRLRER